MKKALFLLSILFMASCASTTDYGPKPLRSVASEYCTKDRYFVNPSNYFDDYEACKDF